MSAIRTAVHESLPYVDPEPTPMERHAAEDLIAKERLRCPATPAIIAARRPIRPNLGPTWAPEISRAGVGIPMKAIDLSRYEASTSPDDLSDKPAQLAGDLRRAYAALTYLNGRHAHLQLLDAYGKNAWLVGNWQLERELKALERELEAKKREIDLVNIQRRRAQDEVGGELKGLDEAWKRGVGKVLETEIATETLRQQVLERQRNAA
ncbi:hypothetical protein M426DRAFT_325743 [Hypoxylon sp. CI-4A]|nr:hypothetical protein M426DRAFT_325743 [Hypoxylon sp. CI-4A]